MMQQFLSELNINQSMTLSTLETSVQKYRSEKEYVNQTISTYGSKS